MIETMFSTAVLILALALLRLVLRDKISPGIRYGLWGLVVLCLMVPMFSPFFGDPFHGLTDLFQSRISVMNAADAMHRHVIEGTDFEYLADNVANGHVYHWEQEEPDMTLVRKAAGIDWELWIMLIWVSGSLLLALWMIRVNVRFYRTLARKRKEYSGTVPVFVTKRVYVAEGIHSPCFYGWGADEGIYIPASLSGDYKSLCHALAHEMGHVNHGDRYWGIIRCGLLCMYWVNPMIWLAAVLSKQDCELACDEAAVKLLGEKERYAYGRTLIGMIEERGKSKGLFSIATTMTAGPRTVKERIRILAKHPKTTAAMAAVVAAAVVLLAACTFTGGIESEESGDIPLVEREMAGSHGQPGDSSGQPPASAEQNGKTSTAESTQKPETVPIGQGDQLVLTHVEQWGNYYELTMERQDKTNGRRLPAPLNGSAAIRVTPYSDINGTALSGEEKQDQGVGYQRTGSEEFMIQIWNVHRAGAFNISMFQDDRSVEYMFEAKDRELLEAKIIHQLIDSPDHVKAELITMEKYPNALCLQFQCGTADDAAVFSGLNRMGIRLAGYGREDRLYEPRIVNRAGRNVSVLFCFEEDVFPNAAIKDIAVLKTDQETGVYSALGEDGISLEVFDIARHFCQAYMNGDVKMAARYSALPERELTDAPSMDDSEPTDLRIRYDPQLKEVYAEAIYQFKEKGEDSYTYLNLTLKYAYGEWKVTSKWFEK